jgi:hypothetical protein
MLRQLFPVFSASAAYIQEATESELLQDVLNGSPTIFEFSSRSDASGALLLA